MASPKTPTARKVRDTARGSILYTQLLKIKQRPVSTTPVKSRSKSTPASEQKRKAQAKVADSGDSPAKRKKRKVKEEVSLQWRESMREWR
jgi:hypothetical protein